ncbi:MAG TPA: HD domain-containing phosphohydrolase, partial [Oscillatoriaceae cyanobacterium]
MTERIAPPAKLLPMLAADGRLAQAIASVWEGQSAEAARFGQTPTQWHALQESAFSALRAWAADSKPRPAVQHWLLGLRQDLSLEELLLVLVQLDRAMRQAGWQLGLPAPDWHALSELLSGFFEAVFEAAASGWQGLLAQNHQLRDELAYFHRLAVARDGGQSLDEHLHLAVRETARLLHCEFCAILLPKEDAREVLEIRAAVAPRILSNALAGMSFPLAENGLIAQVFLTGAPASTYQPLDDLEITMRRRQTLESLGFSQLLAYPLQTHGRVLGVLCVANRLDDQPWQALEEEWLATVAGQLSASIRLSQLQARQESSEAELSRALLASLALHDPRLAAHGEAVGTLARAMGAMLGLSGPQLEQLELAGRLHDLGLMGLPLRVSGRAGPLWPAEAAEVRRHPELAAEILGRFKQLAGLVPAVRHHHERWDGEGYPDGLAGQAIPLAAR